MRIAILGAAHTGKTRLTLDLLAQLQPDFASVNWQAAPPLPADNTLAQDHMASILSHPPETLLLCDTTPLLAAVYRDLMQGDTSLYPWALAQQQAFALTLLTGMDAPAAADCQMPIGAVPPEQVNARLREVLLDNRIAFATVYGNAAERASQARLCILGACGKAPDTAPSQWKWSCEKCSDAQCEHRMFSRLLARP